LGVTSDRFWQMADRMPTSSSPFAAPCIRSEFSGAVFGDARLSGRLIQLGESCAAAPEKSLPKASGSPRALAAAYRFFGHDGVTAAAILEPHRKLTVERIAEAKRVLVLHDTSDFAFPGKRDGLGPLHGTSERGFLMHCSLAVTADGTRRPLGVIAATTWTRKDEPRTKKPNGKKLAGSDYAKLKDKESNRWGEQVSEVAERLGASAELIHVMDREADAYALLSDLIGNGHRFVIRMSKDRVARDANADADAWEELRSLVQRAQVVVERDVQLSRRATSSIPSVTKTFPPRDRRVARLAISATNVQLRRPRYEHEKAPEIAVNIVRVHELDTPPEMVPVAWVLLTTEPITTSDEVLAIVDHYRARWLIEEYFKALKTGCEIEKLQLESYASLRNALALYIPIAWSILLLRNLARDEPHSPAVRVLSSTQIRVLRAVGPMKLGAAPTVGEAMLAVAMMGGYIKHRIGPGWLVLARGMQDLVLHERGWLAREKAEKDMMDH
jgi:hypothetical protein